MGEVADLAEVRPPSEKNTTLNNLLGIQREQIQLPFGPIYKDTIRVSSAQSEPERLAMNAQ